MRLTDWRQTPPGGSVAEPGSTLQEDTGAWRVQRPVIDWEACTHCLICWVYCPDSALHVRDGKLLAVDYEHCKGCGICAQECPRRCIAMVLEPGIEGAP